MDELELVLVETLPEVELEVELLVETLPEVELELEVELEPEVELLVETLPELEDVLVTLPEEVEVDEEDEA